MSKRITILAAALTVTILVSLSIAASIDQFPRPSDLVVHEWGTFTTVAGPAGNAIDWLPLSGPNDLPCFVKRLDIDPNNRMKRISPTSGPLSYAEARSQLIGSVRMETPVLYFYSQQPREVRVRVDFPHGLVTEWYPEAQVTPTLIQRNALTDAKNTRASITWEKIRVLPFAKTNFPMGSQPSHYYAARETDAAPIQTAANGTTEKFLFYRGVGDFPAPINATVTKDGRILVKHLAGKPSVILFESRGGKLGYRVVDTSRNEALLDLPSLT